MSENDRRMTEGDRLTMEEYYAEQERQKMKELREDGLLETGPEEVGGASYSPGETKTCSDCEEETPAKQWKADGPTGTQLNGVATRSIVGEYCPACGHFQ